MHEIGSKVVPNKGLATFGDNFANALSRRRSRVFWVHNLYACRGAMAQACLREEAARNRAFQMYFFFVSYL